jgi:hypothetical protein
MKQTINFNQFCTAFRDMNRDNSFSYEGKRALFDYLEQYEEDTDTEVDLDVIALCCEYTEYEDVEDYLKDYYGYSTVEEGLKALGIEKEEEESEEEFKERIKEEVEEHLNDNTTLIKLSDDLDDGFIIGCY